MAAGDLDVGLQEEVIKRIMRKIEYKTVKYEQGLGKRLSGDDFGESFLRVLAEQGQEGWDLKEIIRESGMQAILIFSREVSS